jgi:hypothetical protein
MKLEFDDKEFRRDIQKMTKKLDDLGRAGAKEAFDIVDAVTDKTMEESINRAPIDEGFLVESHEKKVEKSTVASEVEGHVFIPTNSPASDYALYMHEGRYKLGAKSQEKQAGSEVVVGRKFLQRALTENAKKFQLYIFKKLKEFLK